VPLHPEWADLSFRILLAVLAGLTIGFNRELRGHAAGLRTTLLVCVAAALAMILANLLLADMPDQASGPGHYSLDFMRLPLGILSGIGFIGGGAILRRGDLVTGLTTAASLWLSTVIGLCFGSGQLILGVAGTVIGVLALWGLHWLEHFLPRERHGMLLVEARGVNDLSNLATEFEAEHFRIQSRSVTRQQPEPQQILRFDIVYWASEKQGLGPRLLVDRLIGRPGVIKVQWTDGGFNPRG
jgi:putative Mg2+ transporter-C (MgtC) family protein